MNRSLLRIVVAIIVALTPVIGFTSVVSAEPPSQEVVIVDIYGNNMTHVLYRFNWEGVPAWGYRTCVQNVTNPAGPFEVLAEWDTTFDHNTTSYNSSDQHFPCVLGTVPSIKITITLLGKKEIPAKHPRYGYDIWGSA
jgi:hypothetical protein